MLFSIIINSSPPNLATVSVLRSTPTNLLATCCSKTSPPLCPIVSLTDLKLSKSINIIEISLPVLFDNSIAYKVLAYCKNIACRDLCCTDSKHRKNRNCRFPFVQKIFLRMIQTSFIRVM